MRIILLLSIISMSSFSQRAQVKKYSDALGIDSKSNGACKYNRNNLNKAHLNNIYGTALNHSVSDVSEKSITENFSCIFFKRNLRRDSNKYDVAPEKVFSSLDGLNNNSTDVEGKIRYVGLIPAKYKYKINKIEKAVTVNVKIHFDISSKDISKYQSILIEERARAEEYIKNKKSSPLKALESLKKETINALNKRIASPKEDILKAMDSKLSTAESTWQTGAGADYTFKFERVEDKAESHFSVKLTADSSRGPYYKEWSILWSDREVAHEIGHMMGLDDEYDNILYTSLSGLNGLLVSDKNESSIKESVCKQYDDPEDVRLFGYFRKLSFGADRASKCDKNSIMCDHLKGVPQKWHIYTILKRAYLKK